MATTLVAVGLAASLAACTASRGDTSNQSGAHASRAHLYSSVQGLAADSTVVIVGTVGSHRVAADITPDLDFTISTVVVQRVVKSTAGVQVGSSINVRQVGSDKQPAPAPLLAEGTDYLLFLTPSGLDGKLAAQYYVTGGNAGLYGASGAQGSAKSATDLSATKFGQLARDPGDNLPSGLTLAELGN